MLGSAGLVARMLQDSATHARAMLSCHLARPLRATGRSPMPAPNLAEPEQERIESGIPSSQVTQ